MGHVAAMPERMVGNRGNVAHLVEKILAIFASIGFQHIGIGFVFIALRSCHHKKSERIEQHQIENRLPPIQKDLVGCALFKEKIACWIAGK